MTNVTSGVDPDCQAFENLQRVWPLLTDPDLDTGTKLERVFAAEPIEDFDYAFKTRIDTANGRQHVEVAHGSHDRIQTGESLPLSETYCRKTIASPEGTMAVSDALAEGWGDDPAYERFELGSYLGSAVFLEDEVYGTFCFASSEPRDRIPDAEVELVEMLADWVEYELHLWEGPPTSEPPGVDLGEFDVPLSPEMDAMMEALGRRPRRSILLDLLESGGEREIGELVDESGLDFAEVALRHTHLPKLANAGYVEWDSDDDTVSRGSDFTQIAPLLRLIRDYSDEFSAV